MTFLKWPNFVRTGTSLARSDPPFLSETDLGLKPKLVKFCPNRDLALKGITVLFRPKVHGMSPVTSIVHWIQCSFLGNHGKIPINGNSADAGSETLVFFGLFGSQNRSVTVTWTKLVQFRTFCHPSPEPLVEIVQYQGSCFTLQCRCRSQEVLLRKQARTKMHLIGTKAQEFSRRLEVEIVLYRHICHSVTALFSAEFRS